MLLSPRTATLEAKISPYVYPGIELARGELEMGLFVRDVCARLDIEFSGVVGPRRHRKYVEVRQACYYALVRREKKTTISVGKYFDRDHASVIHGCKVWANLLSVNDTRAWQIQSAINLAYIDHYERKKNGQEKNL